MREALQKSQDITTGYRGMIAPWYMLGVLLLANILSFVDRMLLSLLINPIRETYSISDTEASLLMGFSFALFYSFLGLPLGIMADRVHRRNLIIIGLIVWSVATAYCGLATSFGLLFLARVFVGAGEAVLSPAAYSLIGNSFPKASLAKAIGIYSLGVPIGAGVAMMLGGWILTLDPAPLSFLLPNLAPSEQWRASFVWVALPSVVVVLLLLFVREPKRRAAPISPRKSDGLSAFLKTHKATVFYHLLGNSLLTTAIYGSLAWVPTFLVRTYQIPMADAALRYGIISAACGSLGVLMGGWLCDLLYRRGREDSHFQVIRFGAIVGGPFIVATTLMPEVWMAFTALAFGVMILSFQGIAGAALQLFTPDNLRARMTAIYFFFANLIGLGLGPTLIALVTDNVFGNDADLRYAMAIVTAVTISAAILVLSLGLKPFRESIRYASRYT